MVGRYRFGGYLAGSTAARTADEMSAPALLLVGLAAGASAGQASFLYGGLTVAAVLGGPLFGVLLDRATRPGRVLAAALGGYATGLVVIEIVVIRGPMPVAVVVAVVTGLLAPAISGGWSSRLPDVVEPAGMTRASALDAATFTLASLVGPAAAGALAALPLAGGVGAYWALVVSVAVLVAAIPFAWRLPRHRHAVTDRPVVGVRATLRDGFGALLAIPPLRRTTLASNVSFAGFSMVLVACPLLGRAHLGGAGRGALLLSVLAAASLLATGVLARRGGLRAADRTFLLATLGLGLAVLLVAVPHPVAIIAGIALVGLAEGPQFTAVLAVRHREAPDGLRGQIFTTAASLKITCGALGAVAAGALATRSLTLVLLVAAAAQVLALAVFAVGGGDGRQRRPRRDTTSPAVTRPDTEADTPTEETDRCAP